MGHVARLFKAASERLVPVGLLAAYRNAHAASWRLDRLQNEVDRLSRNQMYLLRELRAGDARDPLPQRVEFLMQEYRVYSQAGEDGILDYLFRTIGTMDRRFVEIGVEDGRMCNTALLSIQRGWSGLLVDASATHVAEARRHYAAIVTLRPGQVRVAQSFVTAENVDGLLAQQGFGGEIDLLSVDIDGNDYWVWKAMASVSPRVVVIEYNSFLGPERALAREYDPSFAHPPAGPTVDFGASLPALARLGESKGYSLVACSSSGVNAFFVRDDVMRAPLHRSPPTEAYHRIEPENERWFHVQGVAPRPDDRLFCEI